MQLPQDFAAIDFDGWRAAVRPLLGVGAAEPVQLPRPLMRLLETLACYREPGRWELMYRLAWRTLHENRRLLEDHADPDVHRATAMERAIRRDVHKMHAYVRFRETGEGQAGGDANAFFAWFEPQHEILRRATPFFVRRFPNMKWTLATPDGAAVWEDHALKFIASPALAERPAADEQESLWRTYYRSICNVARLNPSMMQKEMPQRYWRHLPEAVEIRALLHEGRAGFAQRQRQVDQDKLGMARAVKEALQRLPPKAGGPADCRRCELWKHATQAVLGAGPQTATLMLVGEQPGDEEDLKGEPFVGPAGRLLDQLIAEAGLARRALFVTNAVKHFKWEPRGKRRLHKRPDVAEIDACGMWLEREINLVQPQVIVALGATALRALTGATQSIDAAREQVLRHPGGALVIASYHPAAILRAPVGRAEAIRELLLRDLTAAGKRVTERFATGIR